MSVRRLLSKTLIRRYFMAKRWICKTQVCRDSEMPDPRFSATGIHRREIEALMEGNCDPYHNDVLKRGAGTRDNPTLIPSAFNGRIVGCLCHDHRFAKWMWLEKGCPKRCECGHWFKLKEVKPL